MRRYGTASSSSAFRPQQGHLITCIPWTGAPVGSPPPGGFLRAADDRDNGALSGWFIAGSGPRMCRYWGPLLAPEGGRAAPTDPGLPRVVGACARWTVRTTACSAEGAGSLPGLAPGRTGG